MKRIVSAVLAVLMIAALFVGCSSGPEGKYVVKSIDGRSVDDAIQLTANSGNMSKEDFLKEIGVDKAEEIVTIELKSDGTAVVDIKMFETTNEGTWKQDGDNIAITVDGETADFALKGNELTSKMGEQQYVFIKK